MNLRAEEIIDSVGIEMEFSSICRESREFMHAVERKVPGFQLDHDASCETPELLFGNLPVTFKSEKDTKVLGQFCRKAIIGGEIKSPISMATSEQWVASVYNLCDVLKEFGETEESQRDSLHVHINVSKEIPLFVLKNLLRLETAFEAILFRLGGMGRMNRGESNDFIYQRPFLGNGPPVIWDMTADGSDKLCYPCLNIDDLFAATGKKDFFERYGNAYNSAGRVRYSTCRYMLLNFYSILTYGSLEFRTANKTLNPDYILAWVNFARAFVEKAFVGRDESFFESVSRPLYANREIPTHEFVNALNYLTALDITTKNVLLDIWMRSPTPKFDNVWRFTHLPQPTRFGNSVMYRPKSIDSALVEPARFVDLHILQGEPAPVQAAENIINDFHMHRLGEVVMRAPIAEQLPFIIDPVQGLCDKFAMEEERIYQINWGDVSFMLRRTHHNNRIAVKIDWLYVAEDEDGEEHQFNDVYWIEAENFQLSTISTEIKDMVYDDLLPDLLLRMHDEQVERQEIQFEAEEEQEIQFDDPGGNEQ